MGSIPRRSRARVKGREGMATGAPETALRGREGVRSLSFHVSESELLRDVLRYLTVRGVLVWRMPVQGVMQGSGESMRFKRSPIRGFPDIAGVHHGILFALECKTEKGKVSEPQAHWIHQLNKAGAVAQVIKPALWRDEVDRILAEIEARAKVKMISYTTSA